MHTHGKIASWLSGTENSYSDAQYGQVIDFAGTALVTHREVALESFNNRPIVKNECLHSCYPIVKRFGINFTHSLRKGREGLPYKKNPQVKALQTGWGYLFLNVNTYTYISLKSNECNMICIVDGLSEALTT